MIINPGIIEFVKTPKSEKCKTDKRSTGQTQDVLCYPSRRALRSPCKTSSDHPVWFIIVTLPPITEAKDDASPQQKVYIRRNTGIGNGYKVHVEMAVHQAWTTKATGSWFCNKQLICKVLSRGPGALKFLNRKMVYSDSSTTVRKITWSLRENNDEVLN